MRAQKYFGHCVAEVNSGRFVKKITNMGFFSRYCFFFFRLPTPAREPWGYLYSEDAPTAGREYLGCRAEGAPGMNSGFPEMNAKHGIERDGSTLTRFEADMISPNPGD